MFAHFGSKIAKMTILEVLTLVSQSLSHIFANNIACLYKGLKIKILFKEFNIWAFLGLKYGSRLGQK